MTSDRPTIRLSEQAQAIINARPEGQTVSAAIHAALVNADMAAANIGTTDLSRLPRAAERYAEIVKRHGIDLTDDERQVLGDCLSGTWADPLLLRHLADEVMDSDHAGTPAATSLAEKLRATSFADIVATVEKLEWERGRDLNRELESAVGDLEAGRYSVCPRR